MNEKQTDSHGYLKEDSIDFTALLKILFDARKLVVKSVSRFFIVGCIVALLSPVIYTSETTFVPQTSDDQISSSRKGLGSLAGLVGINLNAAGSSNDSYLSPLLYPKIADSEEFSIHLLNETIINLDGSTIAVKDYLTKDPSGFNLIGFIKKYTIGLFSSDSSDEAVVNSALDAYNFISEEDFKMITSLQTKFSIEINGKEGYIKVIATDEVAPEYFFIFASSQEVMLLFHF